MPEPITSSTSITIGVLTAIAGFFVGTLKWLLGLKKDVDLHTEQLDALEAGITKANAYNSDLTHEMKAISERTVRLETKIDLLIEKRIN